MLINNKSLINTINKLNLTDDEREKFNKISEDDRGNFLYNGKPIINGATAEQAAQIEANKNAIGDENNGLTKEINDINNALTRVDAITLNGKKFSNSMTKDEYDSIVNKDPNTIYLVNDEQVINNVPDYSTSDANKVLAVNSTGTSLAWIDAPTGEGGSGLTVEQINQLQTAYQHSQSSHVQASDISGLQPKTDNTLATTNKTIVGAINEIKNDIVSEIPVYSSGDIGKVLAVDSSGSSLTWAEVSNTGSLLIRDLVAGEIFIKGTTSTPTVTYGNIVASTTNLTINENDNTTFTVKLDKAPTNNQVINITVNNSYCTVNPSSLTFLASNYSEPQTVTVTGLHDNNDYNNKNSIITLSSSNVTSKTINVTINNIDEQPSETIPVQSITLNKTESTLNVGDSEQLTVTFNPSNATNQNVTWASNNNEIATVVSGLVTANASGNATISVTSEDGNKTASCSYIVQESSVTDPDKPDDESMVLFVNNSLSKEATAEDKTNILVDHTNNHIVKATSRNANPSFVPKIISDDGTAIQFMNGIESGQLKALNSGKLTSLNNTVEIYFESTADIGSGLISIYDNRGESGSDTFGGHSLRISNNRIGFGDGSYLYMDVTTTIEPNIKYHLVAVSDFNNKKAYMYLNGVKLDEKDVRSFNAIKEHDVKLGQPSQSNIKYYYFKVYNRALSESEIQTKYEGVN